MTGHRFRTKQQRPFAERYSGDHKREKERWRPAVEAGEEDCRQGLPGNGSSGTCLFPTRRIERGQAWALGHTDDGTAWIGPVHALCNQREAASRGGRIANARRRALKQGPKRPVGW